MIDADALFAALAHLGSLSLFILLNLLLLIPKILLISYTYLRYFDAFYHFETYDTFLEN